MAVLVVVAPSRPRAVEPPVAGGVGGPAMLAAAVMLFVHLAAGAMLGALADTASPGPGTAGGVWDLLVWLASAALAAASSRPVLRRTLRPLRVAVAAGLMLAAAYAAIATLLVGPGASTSHVVARTVSLALAAVVVGAWTRAADPDEPTDQLGPRPDA